MHPDEPRASAGQPTNDSGDVGALEEQATPTGGEDEIRADGSRAAGVAERQQQDEATTASVEEQAGAAQLAEEFDARLATAAPSASASASASSGSAATLPEPGVSASWPVAAKMSDLLKCQSVDLNSAFATMHKFREGEPVGTGDHARSEAPDGVPGGDRTSLSTNMNSTLEFQSATMYI